MAFSPLDEELELLAGKLTPRGHEQLVRLSSYMPFEQAVELFEDFMGIHVSKDVGQRYTEEAGAVYEELQTEEVEELQKKRPKTRVMSGELQISADGCMVPLLHGVWAEVKTVVIGEVQPAVLKAGERVVRTRNLSYFSRKTGSEEFERLSLGEMHRRGVENAKAVVAVIATAWSRVVTKFHGLSLSTGSAHSGLCPRGRTHPPDRRIPAWSTLIGKQSLARETPA